jgi:hypothetical protein
MKIRRSRARIPANTPLCTEYSAPFLATHPNFLTCNIITQFMIDNWFHKEWFVNLVTSDPVSVHLEVIHLNWYCGSFNLRRGLQKVYLISFLHALFFIDSVESMLSTYFWLQTLAIRKISMKRNPGTNPRRWPAPTHVTLQLAKPSLSTSYCKVARISHYAQTYTDAEFPHSTQSRIIFPLKIARISCTCAQGVHAPTPLALPRDHRSRFSS